MRHIPQQKAYTRYLGTAFACFTCFAKVVLCATITGCAQSASDTAQELADIGAQLVTTETEEQNARIGIVVMQAAVRGHQVRKRLHEVKAVTSIQKYTRKTKHISVCP